MAEVGGGRTMEVSPGVGPRELEENVELGLRMADVGPKVSGSSAPSASKSRLCEARVRRSA